MKLTEKQLRSIIKEELESFVQEDKNMPKGRITRDIEGDGQEMPRGADGEIDWKKADQMAADIRLKKPETRLAKEELSGSKFAYAADRIANALQGAGAVGDEYEIQQYIAAILNNPDDPPRMPGKYSSKVGGHEAVAAAVVELFAQAGGRPNRTQMIALASEIAKGIRSRNEG